MLLFIWGNSLLPAEQSSRESGFVLALLRPMVEALQTQLERAGHSWDEMYLIRKMAHFAEYALLGVLMTMLFWKPGGRSRVLFTMLLCLAAAFVDEGIQFLSEGRAPALRDVAIDFAGAVTGTAIASLLASVLRALRRKPSDDRQ